MRIVRLPSGIDAPGYVFHRETRQLYLRLIAGRRSHRIALIDEWGVPWIDSKHRDSRCGWIYHSLALNDDSWVAVPAGRVEEHLRVTAALASLLGSDGTLLDDLCSSRTAAHAYELLHSGDSTHELDLVRDDVVLGA